MRQQLLYSWILVREKPVFRSDLKTTFQRWPASWVWLMSLATWVWLFYSAFIAGGSVQMSHPSLVTMVYGSTDLTDFLIQLSASMLPWMLMVIAMMFPLLNTQVEHVAFSLPRSERAKGVLSFLSGYSLTWLAVGAGLQLLIAVIDMLLAGRSAIFKASLPAVAFLLAAAVVWWPQRIVWMAACGLRMPLRINTWKSHLDSFNYGMKKGFVCARTCWIPMFALMLAHHNLWTMALVTLVLIYERYLIPHESKLIGYAWLLIAAFFTGLALLSLGQGGEQAIPYCVPV